MCLPQKIVLFANKYPTTPTGPSPWSECCLIGGAGGFMSSLREVDPVFYRPPPAKIPRVNTRSLPTDAYVRMYVRMSTYPLLMYQVKS